MEKVFNFIEAAYKEFEAALTPEAKKSVCEGLKRLISVVFKNHIWSNYLVSEVNALEATIK